MQDPTTGRLEPIPDNRRTPPKTKKNWPVFAVGEEVSFRGWWWKITGFTTDGGIAVKATRKVKKSGPRSRARR